jgi:hypothetical protein
VEAKVLYGLLLDRMGLSLRSGWLDDQGRVYIYFTVKDIRKHLHCGQSKAMQLLKELDEGVGLIRRKRQGQGKPDQIYVMNFVTNSQTSEKQHSEPVISPENAPEQRFQSAENQTSENQTSEKQTSEIQPSRGLNFTPLDVRKTNPNKNNINKNDLNETDSIHPIYPVKSVEQMMDEMDRAKKLLKEKWGYAALVDSLDPDTVDGVIALGADVLCSQSPTIRVGKQDLPREIVTQRLLALDFTHIEYVFECLQKSETPIRNIRAYLLTALYNAPTTIDSYFGHEVARDKAVESSSFSPNNQFIKFYQSLKGECQ